MKATRSAPKKAGSVIWAKIAIVRVKVSAVWFDSAFADSVMVLAVKEMAVMVVLGGNAPSLSVISLWLTTSVLGTNTPTGKVMVLLPTVRLPANVTGR